MYGVNDSELLHEITHRIFLRINFEITLITNGHTSVVGMEVSVLLDQLVSTSEGILHCRHPIYQTCLICEVINPAVKTNAHLNHVGFGRNYDFVGLLYDVNAYAYASRDHDHGSGHDCDLDAYSSMTYDD